MSITLTLGEWINDQLHNTGITSNMYVGEGIAAVIFFALTILFGWIVYHIFERYFTKWAQKTETTLDDEIIKNIKKPLYFFVILIGSFYAVSQLSMLDSYTKEIAHDKGIHKKDIRRRSPHGRLRVPYNPERL